MKAVLWLTTWSLMLVGLSKAVGIGCPHGMFAMNPVNQCFKFINERMTWSQAQDQCASEGLRFARPSDSISLSLRIYITLNYGCCYSCSNHNPTSGACSTWVAAKGYGRTMDWSDGSTLDPDLLWDGDQHLIETYHCLSLYTSENAFGAQKTHPYTVWNCTDTMPVLCEGNGFGEWTSWDPCPLTCGSGVQIRSRTCIGGKCVGTGKDTDYQSRPCNTVPCPVHDSTTNAPIELEVVGSGIKLKPSSDVPNPIKEMCGLSTSFDERFASGHLNITEKIVGGSETIAGKYPWMVHLSFYNSFFDDTLNCGGSLISKRWVLTAAHCIRHLEKNIPVYVRIGYVNLKQQESQSELFAVYLDDIITHDEFSASTLKNDIALVRLKQDVSFNSAIQPICLGSNKQIPFQRKAVAAGWGLLDPGDTEIPDILQEVPLDVMAENSCESPQHFICTSTVGRDTCKGDSGGPLMIQQGTQWYIIGIVSHGPSNCGSSNLPGVYTRVPNYLPFITSHINL